MLKWFNKKRNKKGFTLIEMVIVIAILGILIAIAVPRLAGFRDRAQDSADKATAATIGKAAELYYATEGVPLYTPDGLVDNKLIEPGEYNGFRIDWDSGFAIVFKESGEGEVQLYPEKGED
ncbi:MAG: prepilin-type N-terminal cleavage/methylation domain-containing protein [Tissierellaceae bacterium]